MKGKQSEIKLPDLPGDSETTPEGFTRTIHDMLVRIISLAALLLLSSTVLHGQDDIPDSSTDGIAAFDPVWLDVYYRSYRSAIEASPDVDTSAARPLASVRDRGVPVVTAQKTPHRSAGWYAGISGGVPFGVSAYSSFGKDKTRAGWSTGVYGGYRFSPVLSLEVQAAWGETNLASRGCCPDYWLGSDGVLYEAAVAGMEGWNYAGLKSRVSTQRYGAQLNVNLLGFFAKTRYSRWTLEVSPLLTAYGTKATFRTLDGGSDVVKDGTRWHFGAGGNLQAGYAVTSHLSIGLYTGLTWLSGDPLDGTPEHLHKANCIWESGLKLGWRFGKQGKEGNK